MKLTDIKPNPDNPRVIRDEKFKRLCNSIQDFPKMMELRPIVVDSDNVVLGGNMRLKALQSLGFKDVPDSWVKRAEDLTEEEKKRFIITDNAGFGEWDWDMLANEWNADDLVQWGLDVPVFDVEEDKTVEAHAKLIGKFIIPPFSILDTRQGYWQERKRYWKELIGDNGESRENTLFRSSGDPVSDKLQERGGVSILDPVLSELVNLWFGLKNCKTFDCFAGDSVFGYVSSYLGNQFTGIELREEQSKLNNERIIEYKQSKYICDDGQNVLTHIEPNSQDLLFSCPPYFDLEVYSDLQNDASNQKEYKDFIKILDNAFTSAIQCLKDNRFAVITVGDVRDKKGFYYRFVDDIKDIFKRNGVNLYNEIILIESAGTAALRAVPNMQYRKVVKTHQNVLVFFKGYPKQIKNIYPKIEIPEYASENL